MWTRYKRLLDRKQKEIIARRRTLLESLFFRYRYFYNMPFEWNCAGDLANDYALNSLYQDQEAIIKRYYADKGGRTQHKTR